MWRGTDEYTEWHLTPRGWESGTVKLDFQRRDSEAPLDRVLTCRYCERSAGGYYEGVEERWRSDDGEAVERLLADYGECPKRLVSV